MAIPSEATLFVGLPDAYVSPCVSNQGKNMFFFPTGGGGGGGGCGGWANGRLVMGGAQALEYCGVKVVSRTSPLWWFSPWADTRRCDRKFSLRVKIRAP